MATSEEKIPTPEVKTTESEPSTTSSTTTVESVDPTITNLDNSEKSKKKHRHSKDRPRDPESEERRRIRKEKKRREREEREKLEKDKEISSDTSPEKAAVVDNNSDDKSEEETSDNNNNLKDSDDTTNNNNDNNEEEKPEERINRSSSISGGPNNNNTNNTNITNNNSTSSVSSLPSVNSTSTVNSNSSMLTPTSSSNTNTATKSGSGTTVAVIPGTTTPLPPNSSEKRSSKELTSPKPKKSLLSRLTDFFHGSHPIHPHDDPKHKDHHSPQKPSSNRSSDVIPVDHNNNNNNNNNDTDSINLSESPANIHGNIDDHHKDSNSRGSNTEDSAQNDGKRDSSDKGEMQDGGSPRTTLAPGKEVVNPDHRVRQLRFPCSCIEDLPKDLKKIVRSTRVPDEVFEKDLQALLNILHFITKKVYITTRAPGPAPKIEGASDSPVQERKSEGKPTQKIEEVKVEDSEEVKPAEEKPEGKPEENPAESTEVAATSEVSEKAPTSEISSPVLTSGVGSALEVSEPPATEVSEVLSTSPPTSTVVSPLVIAPSTRSFLKKELKEIEAMIVKNKNPKDLFKSLKKSGRGGFGTVFAAKNAEDGKKVAIKRVRHTTPKERLDNINEVRYALRCGDHPNIVKMKQIYEWKDECWMVMEFLEGGTLTEARRGHEWEEKEIAYVARELLRGLSHIHKLNLVHRDVKSENIMMSILGDIKLIDFGLCSDNALIRPCMVGSPYWMPPEMLNRKNHSFPCDIWSFGVSLLELANKNPPNAHNKLKVMFTTATIGKPNPFEEPQRWSEDFKDFIAKCLAFDPSKRPSADELLNHKFIAQAANTRKVMRKILSEIFLQKAIGLM